MQLALSFPQYDPVVGLVAVRINARAALTETEVQAWAQGLPEGRFYLDRVDRIRLTEKREQPITPIYAFVAPGNLPSLRWELAELFDEGTVLTSDLYAPMFAEAYTSSETWLLPQAPDDLDVEGDCNDPEVHHAFITAAAEVVPAIDHVLDLPQMPETWDVNDPFGIHGAAETPRVLLTAEHHCARQGMGISDLCNATHYTDPEPLQRGLVELWEGATFPASISMPAMYMDPALVTQLEEIRPGFLGVVITADVPLIGYRDGARAWVQGQWFDDLVRLHLAAPLYLFPADPAQVVLLWEEAQQELTFVEFELTYPRSRWNLSASFDLQLSTDVEDLAAGTVLPFREAVVAMLNQHELEQVLISGGEPQAWDVGIIDSEVLIPAEFAAVDDLLGGHSRVLIPTGMERADWFGGGNSREPLSPGEAQLASDLFDLLQGLEDLGGEQQLPFFDLWLWGTLLVSLEEWAEGIGPFMGQYALAINNRLGGDDQHEGDDSFEPAGIVGLGAVESTTNSVPQQCWKSYYDIDNSVTGAVDPGLTLVLQGYDEEYSPTVGLDGRNVGAARWVKMAPEQLMALTSVAHLQDPEATPAGRYPNNPLNETEVYLDGFLQNLISAALDVGIMSLDDEFCDERWADRASTELADCDQLCLDTCDEEGGWFDCLFGCMLGCDAYYQDVETSWDLACTDPDYMFTELFSWPGADKPMCANIRKASVDVDNGRITGEERPVFGDWHTGTEIETISTGFNCALFNCETDYGLEVPVEQRDVFMVEYDPPVYLEERGDQIFVHVPVGVTFKFDLELTVDTHADMEPGDADMACPPIPVNDETYDIREGNAEWETFHMRRSEAEDQGITVADQAATFDAWDGYQGVQVVRGTGTLAGNIEWVFPIEVERRWQYSGLYWAENAYPVNLFALEEPRADVTLDLGLDAFCFHLDEDASDFNPIEMPQTGVNLLNEDYVQNEVAHYLSSPDPCDNLLTRQVNALLPSVNNSLQDITTRFLSPTFLQDLESDIVPDIEGKDTVAALGNRAGHPTGLPNMGLDNLFLAPTAYRALVYEYPLERWLRDDLLGKINPARSVMIPRWMVLDDWWREEVCDPFAADGINCWDTLLAGQGSTVELGDAPVTGPGGLPLDEAVSQSWPASEGLAGWLLFEVGYAEDQPPEHNRNIPAPPSYMLEGFAQTEYAWNSGLEFQALEDPGLLPPWDPGQPGEAP